MKICRFRTSNAQESFGVITEENIIYKIDGDIFGDFQQTANTFDRKDVKLLPPYSPKQMYGPGLNFLDHLQMANEALGTNATTIEQPDPWFKSITSIIGEGENVVIPKDSPSGIQYEGECIAVIGKTTRRADENTAWDNIFGYTCGNDISERTWQRDDREFWRAKGSDTFAPIGPWIETSFNPREQNAMIVRVNGLEVQKAYTSDMFFNFGKLISFISQAITLSPGDMIWSGTSGHPENMSHGDIVEVEVENIGILTNKVVNE